MNFININKNPPIMYNIDNFRTNIMQDYLKDKIIIHSTIQWDKCGNALILKHDNNYLEWVVGRCRSRQPPHNVKVNIRKDSVLKSSRLPI